MTLLSACGTLGDREPSAEDVIEEWGAEKSEEDYRYGYGKGETREVAAQKARRELAHQVVTNIESRIEQEVEYLRREGEIQDKEAEHTTEDYTSTVISTSRVQLEGAQITRERQVDGQWVFEVRLEEAQMEEFLDRMEEQAPVMAWVEILQAIPDVRPGRRFDLAWRGMSVAENYGLEDELIYLPEEERITFAAYFQSTARAAADQLEVIPVFEGGQVYFAVVDAESLVPQRKLRLRIGGVPLITDDSGRTKKEPLRTWSGMVDVEVIGASGDQSPFSYGERHVKSMRVADWRDTGFATLYVYTQPANVLVKIDGDERATPARFRVDDGAEYSIQVQDDAYHGSGMTVEVPEGSAAVYWPLALSERDYGEVDLSAGRDDTLLRLDRGSGDPTQGMGELRGTIEVGTYEVTVTREDQDYEEVQDQIRLIPDEQVQRSYRPLRHRDPYYNGLRVGLTLASAGGEPKDDHKIPFYGMGVDFGEANELLDIESDRDFAPQLGAQAQYFADTLRLTGVTELSYRRASYTFEQDDVYLETTQLSIGTGVWHTFRNAQMWLTVNHAWSSSEWSSTGDSPALSSGESTANTYQFAEVGLQLGPWLASARVSVLDGSMGLKPMLLVGWGRSMMSEGYRHPQKSVEAIRGIHYDPE